jgi:hypothetical protein
VLKVVDMLLWQLVHEGRQRLEDFEYQCEGKFDASFVERLVE